MIEYIHYILSYLTLTNIILLFVLFRGRARWKLSEREPFLELNHPYHQIIRQVGFWSLMFFPIWGLFMYFGSPLVSFGVSMLYFLLLLFGYNKRYWEYQIMTGAFDSPLRRQIELENSLRYQWMHFYSWMYSQHGFHYRDHEYYLWWLMEDEHFVWKIRAFRQWIMDVIYWIIIMILPIPWAYYMVIEYLPTYHIGDIPIVLWLGWPYSALVWFLTNEFHQRIYAFDHFFYPETFDDAWGPAYSHEYRYPEDMGIDEINTKWARYYFYFTGRFPIKYEEYHDFFIFEQDVLIDLEEDEWDEDFIACYGLSVGDPEVFEADIYYDDDRYEMQIRLASPLEAKYRFEKDLWEWWPGSLSLEALEALEAEQEKYF